MTEEIGTRPSWVAPWFDTGLEIPEGLTLDQLVKAEVDRLTLAISVVLYASSIPRRLGGEASREDLALDKLRCRRVGHALRQVYRGWDKGAVEPISNDTVKQTGAQLEWSTFAAEHLVEMETRARLVVTWAVRSDQTRWGKTAATNFTNEHRWFTYAMR